MKYNINLIGEEKTSFFDKALYFFLNYLRYILVITQLVVIAVLFYRFSIDQNIIDLKDSIAQKKEIMTVVGPLTAEAKRINDQIDLVKNVFALQTTFSDELQYLFSLFPQSVTANQINIANTGISITGNSTNLNDLQLFYLRLKKDHHFNVVNLQDIARSQSGYGFSLELKDFNK